MLPGPAARFLVDQLDEDLSIGWPDLEVEVSEEVHVHQLVDALGPSENTVSAKLGVVTPSTVISATQSQ